ncbi:condensation domain-containing protein [Pseudomonas purpurea]|uniref:condensation domain-containing protein n=1 Tax=Pseudomonas purpurea TaxID=3136737 RepID=UPI00326477D6
MSTLHHNHHGGDDCPVPATMALYPASAAQKRLWYMTQLSPRSPFYNVTLAIRLGIALNQTAMKAALQDLVIRHEILRTRYLVDQGTVWQKIEAAQGWQLELLDYSAVPYEERANICSQIATDISRLDIDLEAGPVFRVFLRQFADDDHLLILLTHHIATDQRSINLLCQELDALYFSHVASCPLHLPAPLQYRDYSISQLQRFEQKRERLLAYWKTQIPGAAQPLPLPYDTPLQGGDRDRTGREHPFLIEQQAVVSFRGWCRRQHMTEFSGLLCVWGALLHLLTGSERIFIATTTAFRDGQCFSNTLGCFINTLVVNVRATAEDSVASFTQHSRDQLFDALEHRELTYERWVELARAQGEDAEEFISTYLQFQPKSVSTNHYKGPFTPNMNVFNGKAKFPLMLNVSDKGEDFICTIEYESNVFNAQTIQDIAEGFLSVFSSMPANDDACVASLMPESIINYPRPAASPDVTTPPASVLPTLIPAPLNDMEHRLADIWDALLPTRPQHRTDDFFMLGGHSLLLTQLIWEIQKKMGIGVRLCELRNALALGEMAHCIQKASLRGESSPRNI